jgi:hypothetical protein
MKKLIFTFLTLATLQMNAAILVVKEYGVNATYSTIASALTAAVNNDTIVVYDKPSGQQWIENLTIDKNITFFHPTQGTRFKAPGAITIVPKAGMDLYILGWDLNNNSIGVSASGATATSSNRAKITVADCNNIANLDLNIDWVDARIFYNQTNFSGQLVFRHGLAVANVLANSGIFVEQESTTAAQSDSIIVIGNKARWCNITTKEAGVIANNYFYGDYSNPNWTDNPGQGNVMLLRYHNQSASAIFSIVNNTIINDGGDGSTRMAMVFNGFGNMNNVRIINNLIYVDEDAGTTDNHGIWSAGGTSGNPFISHNYINLRAANSGSRYTSFNENNELNYKVLGTNAYGSIDTWGRASSGNANLINKGNYLGEYYDIDLTRNDIGTYGGPYSIDNYLTSGTGKGKVLYVNIKHQLTNLNQILNIKGSAGAKF